MVNDIYTRDKRSVSIPFKPSISKSRILKVLIIYFTDRICIFPVVPCTIELWTILAFEGAFIHTKIAICIECGEHLSCCIVYIS